MTKFFLGLCFTVCLSAADFSIVFIPDVHLNQQSGTDCWWVQQTQYLVAQKDALKLAAVIGGGDFANSAANQPTHVPHAWSTTACSSPSGEGGMSIIDATGLPWLIAIGNHDYDNDSPSGRVTTLFDAQVGNGRLSGKSWYLGYWTPTTGTSKATQAIRFAVSGRRRILVISLEFWARTGALTWAGNLLSTYPNDEAIIITHGYMDETGALATQGSVYGPDAYSIPASGNSDGTEIEAWAAGHPNIRAVLCGHWILGTNVYHTHRTDTNSVGGPLYGTMTNYQLHPTTRSQVVELMEFTGDQVTISQLNTTTGSVDNTTYPPYTLDWTASRIGLFPLPSPRRR